MKLLARLLLLLTTCVVCVLLGELALALLGFEPARGSAHGQDDDHGGQGHTAGPGDGAPHPACALADYDAASKAGLIGLRPHPRFGYVYGRTTHGFADEDPDAMTPTSEGRRVLFLGDSFTAGAGAAEGKGFVARLQASSWATPLRIYNTGVGGYGQNNQLAVLEALAGTLRPDLVVVGLYTGNDLLDNLTPLDRYTAFGGKWIVNYEVISSAGKISIGHRSPDEALRLYQREMGCTVRDPADWTRDLMTSSRVGTQLWLAARTLRAGFAPQPRQGRGMRPHRSLREAGARATRKYLKRMQETARAADVPLLIFIIPDRHASSTELEPSEEYRASLQLVRELGLPHLDPRDALSIVDYWRGGNDHWNDSGHEKAFHRLRECLTDRFEPIYGDACWRRP